MTDVFTPKERSRIMARVKGKNTRPELIVRSMLHSLGFRFRLHRKDLPGNPDIVLPKYRKVIFVHGCFWHGHEGCPRAARPTSNEDFWNNKLAGNIARDKSNLAKLAEIGWEALVVWSCETKNPESLKILLERFFQKVSK